MAGLSFNIKSNSKELEKTLKLIDSLEAKMNSINKKLGANVDTKMFKNLNKQLSDLEKRYEQAAQKVAILDTANQKFAQKEAENTRQITQAITESIQMEKLKNETSKANIQASKEKIAALKLEIEELKKKRTEENQISKRSVSEEELTQIMNKQAN